MLPPLPSQVTDRLASLVDPYLGQDIVTAKVIQEIGVVGNTIHIKLKYLYPISKQIKTIKDKIKTICESAWPDYTVEIDVTWHVARHKVQNDLKHKSGVKNIIAVGSGKGGVGKSTVALQLALALKGLGAKVALLDADIYGPSQPRMLGKQGIKAHTYQKQLIPVANHGIESMSIGYLVEDETPMIWRGPMVSGALMQMLDETAWTECDYMILDLPPGTGDIQLTMAQKLPIAGAVIVTTPQDIALLDATRAAKMFEKVSIPVLGVVENMSFHRCSQCSHQDPLFGAGGGQKIARALNVPLLAQLPLDARLQQACDNGMPLMVSEPDSDLVKPFWDLAQHVAAQLAGRPLDYTAAGPKITTSVY